MSSAMGVSRRSAFLPSWLPPLGHSVVLLFAQERPFNLTLERFIRPETTKSTICEDVCVRHRLRCCVQTPGHTAPVAWVSCLSLGKKRQNPYMLHVLKYVHVPSVPCSVAILIPKAPDGFAQGSQPTFGFQEVPAGMQRA